MRRARRTAGGQTSRGRVGADATSVASTGWRARGRPRRRVSQPTLDPWPCRRSPRRSSSGRSRSARPTACSTSTRTRAAASGPSQRASGGRRAGSAAGSSRSRTSSCRSTAAAASSDTVTGASLVRSHDAIRVDPYRLQVGLVGLEAMLRLLHRGGAERPRVPRPDAVPRRAGRAARRNRAGGPRSIRSSSRSSSSCSGSRASCRISRAASSAVRSEGLVAFSPSAGGAVCARMRPRRDRALAEGARRPRALLGSPIADAPALGIDDRACARRPRGRDVARTSTTAASACGRCRLTEVTRRSRSIDRSRGREGGRLQGSAPPQAGIRARGFRSRGIPLAKRSEPLEHVLERALGDELVGQLVPARSHLAADDAVARRGGTGRPSRAAASRRGS